MANLWYTRLGRVSASDARGLKADNLTVIQDKTTSDRRAQRAFYALALTCVAALPFEMLISPVRHQLALLVGPIGYLFHPALGAVIGFAMAGVRIELQKRALLLASLGLYALGLIVSGVFTGSSPFYIVSMVALGPLFMSAVLAFLGNKKVRDDVFLIFVVSMSVWSLLFIIAAVLTTSFILDTKPAWSSLPIGRLLLAVRNPGGGIADDLLFYKLLGNYNKQSNILAISLILAAYLYVRGRLPAWAWASMSATMSLMLLLMFSRGALCAIGLVGIVLGIIAIFRSDRRDLYVAVPMVAVLAISFSTGDLRGYWKNEGSLLERGIIVSGAFGENSGAFLSTGEFVAFSDARSPRGEAMFCSRKAPEHSLKFYILGYGLGNFGPTICRLPEAESHNAFVDAWIQGGVIGFIGYVGLFLTAFGIGVVKVLRSRFSDIDALYGLAIICTVALLAMREYTFVYLWMQSAGGFVLALGLSLLNAEKPREPLRAGWRT